SNPPPRSSWLPWTLCLLLTATTAYFGYQTATAKPEAKEEDKQANEASTAAPRAGEPGMGKAALTAGGYVVPIKRGQVSPKVGGEVIDLTIEPLAGESSAGVRRTLEEGQYVKKGQVIAKLDPTKYQFEYRRMLAMEAQAQADYDKMMHGNRAEEIKQA